MIPVMSTDTDYVRLQRDGHAGWGGDAHERRRAGWVAAFDRLTGLLPAPPADLLELGCGNGTVAAEATRRGYRVHGVDLSGEAVRWARERVPDGAFQQGDVRALAFPSGAFDVVIDGNCLHCLIGEDRMRCLQEARRVLKRPGVLVVSSMCGAPKDPATPFDRERATLLRDGLPYRTLKPAAAIEAEIAAAGLRVVDRHVATNPWWDHVTLAASHG